MKDALLHPKLLTKFITVNIFDMEREGSRMYDIGHTDMYKISH